MKKQDTRPQEENGTESELKPTRRAVLGAAGVLALPTAAGTATAAAGDTRSARTYEGVWVDMQFGGTLRDADLTLRKLPAFDDEPGVSGAELSMVTEIGEVTISLEPAQAEAVGRALVVAGQDGGRDE
ncbi:hypothetical protein [Halobaculum sp. D14]|uniref:hypothetical protein n=1 Tax=Halobaculum sp. D14 TaxID=3421642 RepID=UPI003EB79F5B